VEVVLDPTRAAKQYFAISGSCFFFITNDGKEGCISLNSWPILTSATVLERAFNQLQRGVIGFVIENCLVKKTRLGLGF
jgi:hypothetical protein